MSQLKESQHLYIPFKDIEIATKNFKKCIGKGGYGSVYKGQHFISGKHTTIAVKRLNEKSGQGLKEFLREVQLLSDKTHPNLITLLGYCDDGNEKIIVYEYAKHGSLNQYIRHGTLTWLERLKICVDAARGLEFLHDHVGKHQSIIHRDIKSANILLDQNWVAKISDLGLSKLSLGGTIVSYAHGTPGYVEPEYLRTLTVKKESDVFSFGMVLFEVLCGRLCGDKDHHDEGLPFSPKLVKDYYQKNKLDEIVDPVLRNQTRSDTLEKFSTIAYRCLLDDRGQRPPMNLVVKELEELVKIIQAETGNLNSDDPAQIKITSSYRPSQQPKPQHEVEHLSDMMREYDQVVHFRSLEDPNEDKFSLKLSKLHTYDDVVERLAYHLNLDDPSKIRLTSSNCWSPRPPKPYPVKYRGVEDLSDMLTELNQISDTLYYEVLDIPLREMEGLRNLKIAFHHATKNEVVIHTIRLPKKNTVGDLINELKTKVELSDKDAELRLLLISSNNIDKILPPNEELEHIYERQTIYAEEVPEEERKMGPQDHLIHVCHFMVDRKLDDELFAVHTFGEPFFLVIHEGATLAQVKVQIQKKLHVSDEEFSKWRFAYMSGGVRKSLQDSDIVSSFFEKTDVYGFRGEYLGLDHNENSPNNKSYDGYQDIFSNFGVTSYLFS